MKTSIRLIKRGQCEAPNKLETSGAKKSVEQSTREMANTVKSWVAEFRQTERAQSHHLIRLNAAFTAASRNTYSGLRLNATEKN
jgi:hypothetical protein